MYQFISTDSTYRVFPPKQHQWIFFVPRNWINYWKQYSLKIKSVNTLVAQLCLTLCDLVDCSPPGSSVHGISLVNPGVGSHSLYRFNSWPRDWTMVSCIAGRFFTFWATREAPPVSLFPPNTLGVKRVSPYYSSPHAQSFCTVRTGLNGWSIWSTLKVEVIEEEKP